MPNPLNKNTSPSESEGRADVATVMATGDKQ